MKRIYTLLIAILSFSSADTKAQTVYSDCIDGTVYFKVIDTSSIQLVPYDNSVAEFNSILAKYSVDTFFHAFRTPELSRVYRMNFIDKNKVDSLIIELQQVYFIEFAEKVDICLSNYTPNDYNANLWHLDVIDAHQAWDLTKGSGSVVIAIVDNAVKTTHPDLAANIWVNPNEVVNGLDDDLNGYVDDINGYDVADDDNNPNPPASTSTSSAFNHGTHVAGIASAVTDNGIGVASIGFRCKIMAVKASPDTSTGSRLYASYEGIDYAISAGADVINMSFGGKNAPTTGQLILNTARARGIVLAAAAGNAGTNVNQYPAAFNNVIAVGATDYDDKKAGFSNYGSYVDVMAPGVSIRSTIAGSNSYSYLSGTSMASPLVAGLAGLILSKNPSLSPADVEALIEAGCENINAKNPGFSGQLGAGRINAFNSLSLVPVSAVETVTAETIHIYPNPSNGRFSFFVNENTGGDAEVRLINLLGQMVYSAEANPGSVMEVNEKQAEGVYLLELLIDNRIAGRTRVVIKN